MTHKGYIIIKKTIKTKQELEQESKATDTELRLFVKVLIP